MTITYPVEAKEDIIVYCSISILAQNLTSTKWYKTIVNTTETYEIQMHPGHWLVSRKTVDPVAAFGLNNIIPL